MNARLWLAAALLLAACDREPAPVPSPTTGAAGPALERAAIAAGVVADPRKVDPTGTFGSDTDAICVLPRADGTYRVGASVDYDADQRCVARGMASGRAALAIDFGGDCRLTATLDGERLSFPATLPAACDRVCTGRASLASLIGDRLGTTATEAASARGADGKLLCAD